MGKIQVETCPIEGLKIITPTVFGDKRGYFMETYNYHCDIGSDGENCRNGIKTPYPAGEYEGFLIFFTEYKPYFYQSYERDGNRSQRSGEQSGKNKEKSGDVYKPPCGAEIPFQPFPISWDTVGILLEHLNLKFEIQ